MKGIKAYIIFVTLVGSRMWSFHGLPDVVFDAMEFVVWISLVAVVLYGLPRLDPDDLQFTSNVSLFLILPLVSTIFAGLFHNQSFFLSITGLRTNFIWLLYFVLHIYKVPRKFVIQWMTVVGVVWCLITIVQQFTYPNYLFYTRNEEAGLEFIRSGMYRFMIDPHIFGLFIVIYYYYRFLQTRKVGLLIFVILGLAGFYFYATRQFAVAALLCMVIASVIQPGKARAYSILMICIVILVLFLNLDALFGNYIEITREQLGTDNIRLHSAKYFLFEYWPHWSTVIFGNGFEHMNSDYGKEIAYLGANYGFYKGDVGIIFPLNTYGLIYALNIVAVNIKGLRQRYYSVKTVYLKIFFINALMLLIISEYYSNGAHIPFFCFTFYLVDRSYKKRMKSEREDVDAIPAEGAAPEL